MTCGQVVNAYQDDREQDEDMTQKDYFLFRTHGTEQMTRSAVLFGLRVSTVLYYLLLLFYDGGGGVGSGGGEVPRCHDLCHFSNEVSPYAWLLLSIQLLNLEV